LLLERRIDHKRYVRRRAPTAAPVCSIEPPVSNIGKPAKKNRQRRVRGSRLFAGLA
jgi:hypothetical protein